jgi:hypothetical protein
MIMTNMTAEGMPTIKEEYNFGTIIEELVSY